jgi:hypothetical protein
MRTVVSEGRKRGLIAKAILVAAAFLLTVTIIQLPARFNSMLPRQGQSAPIALLFIASLGSANTLAP